jgi:hypothetical protein
VERLDQVLAGSEVCRERARGRSTIVAAPGKPWWQLTETPALGFVHGWFWVVIGLGQAILAAIDDDGGWRPPVRLALGVLTVLLGLVYLASALAQRQRERDPSP